MMLRIPAFRHAQVEARLPPGSRPPDRPDGPREHRFAFARRWERKKKTRSLKRAWLILLVDLVLLALISLLGLMLVRRLT